MKKFLYIGLVVLFSILLVGCGEEEVKVEEKLTYELEGFTLEDGVYHKTISNSEFSFEFADAITTNGTYKIYYDEELTSTDDLTFVVFDEGSHTYYIVFEFKETKETIQVNLYRNHIFTVRFDTGCPIKLERVEIEEGSLLTKPEVELVKEGYKFFGWLYDFSDPITSNMTIEAKWIANMYTITYNADGGVMDGETVDVVYGENVILEIPSKEGYEFAGWYYNDKLVNTEQWNVAGDVEIVAKWERETMTFEINYVIVGAVGPNLVRTYSNKEELVLYKPYKNGSEFVGWYYESDFSGEKVTKIPLGTEGNIVLYSRWQAYDFSTKKISIMGDSISTFYAANSSVNSYYTGENQFYYPLYSATVKSVDSTWWKIFVDEVGSSILVNESYSGSMVTSTDVTSAQSDRRVENMKSGDVTPDIIIVYIGTNDFIFAPRLGNTLETFENAYLNMITKMRKNYPMADIYACTLPHENYSKETYAQAGVDSSDEAIDASRKLYNEVIDKIVKEQYLIKIDLSEVITRSNGGAYLGDRCHPNADGMQMIANQVTKTVREYVGIY